jgi:hypothetical protein
MKRDNKTAKFRVQKQKRYFLPVSRDPASRCSYVRITPTWKDRAYVVGNEVLDKKRGNAYGTVFEGHIEVGV